MRIHRVKDSDSFEQFLMNLAIKKKAKCPVTNRTLTISTDSDSVSLYADKDLVSKTTTTKDFSKILEWLKSAVKKVKPVKDSGFYRSGDPFDNGEIKGKVKSVNGSDVVVEITNSEGDQEDVIVSTEDAKDYVLWQDIEQALEDLQFSGLGTIESPDGAFEISEVASEFPEDTHPQYVLYGFGGEEIIRSSTLEEFSDDLYNWFISHGAIYDGASTSVQTLISNIYDAFYNSEESKNIDFELGGRQYFVVYENYGNDYCLTVFLHGNKVFSQCSGLDDFDDLVTSLKLWFETLG